MVNAKQPSHVVGANGSSGTTTQWCEVNNPAGLAASQRRLRMVCIGGGIAGIHHAKKFGNNPHIDYQCYEREPSVGGVWYLNKYPGLCCDIPSHVFSFSWFPNANWSSFYPPAAEILQYLNDAVDRNDLRRFMKLNHECMQAVWDDSANKWRLTIRNEQGEFEDEADILVLGTGSLNNWQYPNVPGLLNFKGKLMHTARWDDSYDFTGKNVAVIGNGASAVQCTPILRQSATHVDIYMRSPTWLAPHDWSDGKINYTYTEEERRKFASNPKELYKVRKHLENKINSGWLVFRRDYPHQKKAVQRLLTRYEAMILDPELRAKVTPDFEFGCRRPTPADQYVACIQEKNVDVIRTAVENVKAEGIVTSDGVEHHYDVIVCATGFDSSYRPRFPVIGLDRADLATLWKDHPEAFLGTMVNKYPNMAISGGPGAPAVNAYNTTELCAEFLNNMIDRMIQRNYKTFMPNETAQREYNEWAQERYKHWVWSGTCRSWYKNNETKRVYVPYPGSLAHYAAVIANINDADYDFKSESTNRYDWLGNGMLLSETVETDDPDYSPYIRLGPNDEIVISSSFVR